MGTHESGETSGVAVSDERDEREESEEGLRAHPRVHWHRLSLIESHPRRIVSLVPSLSEALVLLGLGDRLIGVTEYCVHPAGAFAGLPRLGGTKDADVESIARLGPDLVIANQEENTRRVVGALAERGIHVWVTYPRTVAEGVALLEELAGLGAGSSAIEEVVEPVRAAFAGTERRRREAREHRPRVFCPIWRDPWMTINHDTYIHDLIELCGGTNVFARTDDDHGGDGGASEGSEAGREKDGNGGRQGGDPGRRYPIVDLDQVVAAQPEVILLPDEPYAFDSADAESLASLDMPASRQGRIHLIDGTLVSWYGPRIAESIRIVAGLIAN